MEIKVEHHPSYALAVVDLAPSEAIQCEAGAMVSMTANLAVETNTRGGLFSSFKRWALGGETFFQNTYTSQGGPGEITLAPGLPGDITTVQLNRQTIYIQSGSYLAGDPAVDLDISWGGAKTFFGSEGLFLLKASGSGPVVLSSYGAIRRVDITPDRPYVVDTGHVVAFAGGVDFNVRRVGGWWPTLLSGEGLVCEFSGHGPVWLQTRSTQAFLSWLVPRLPSARTGGGGGRGSGIIGNILRGD